MGTYTTGQFKVTLKRDAPEELIIFLSDCLDKESTDGIIEWGNIFTHIPSMKSFEAPFYQHFNDLFKHELFLCERWTSVIRGNTHEDEPKLSSFVKSDAGNWKLTINCEVKSGFFDIDYFARWIGPFVAGRKHREYIGTSRTEGACHCTNYYVVRSMNDAGYAKYIGVEDKHIRFVGCVS